MNVELNEVDGGPMFLLRVKRAIQTDMKYGIRIIGYVIPKQPINWIQLMVVSQTI